MLRRLFVLLLLAPAALSAQGATEFTLRPGDRIEIRVLRDSAMSRTIPVDERGQAVLPLLGARTVTSTPWPALRDSLLRELGRQFNDSGVSLTPMRRVFVLGFVQRPGMYFADPTTPIAGALALAGGASPEGDLQKIRVLRDGAALFTETSMEDPRVLGELRSGDQIFVDRRGWFDRNSPFVASALVGLAGIVVTLLVSR